MKTKRVVALITALLLCYTGLVAAETTTLGSGTKGNDPVLYLNFDESGGPTAYDKSGNGNDGTLAGSPVPALIQGKFGTALQFDGSDTNRNSTVTISGTSNPELQISGDVTITAWIKPSSTYGDTVEAVLRAGQGADLQYSMFYNPTSKLPYFHWYDGSFKQVNGVTNSVPLDKWSHVGIVRSGTTLSFYVDGNFTNSESVTAPTVAAAQIAIGRTNNAAVAQDYSGLIDDFRIYNYARTPAQINQDCAGGAAAHMGTGEPVTVHDPNVGWWKMDNSWNDSSGNGHNGTASGATFSSSAKIGSYCGSFDGDDYVQIPDAPTFTTPTELTVAAWIKPAQVTNVKGFVNKHTGGQTDGTWTLRDNPSGGTGVGFSVYGATTTEFNKLYVNGVETTNPAPSGTLEVGKWVHLVGVWKGTGLPDNTKQVGIGYMENSSPAWLFNGLIDDVRVYNYALTGGEIRELAETSAPVGHWSMDENTGATAYDRSGSGNDGTITNATWAQGKHGNALSFDGDGDYVSVTQTLSTPITASCWARLTDFTKTLNTFINSSPHTVLAISLNRTGIGDIYVYIGNGTSWLGAPGIISSSNMVVNQWHHVSYTCDGTTSILYLDGVSVGSVNTVPSGWGSYYNFGRIIQGGEYLKGQLDEVKIYNYARTQAQIAWDYNQGKSVGHWKMDEALSGAVSTASGAIKDASGNGYDGTASNTAWSYTTGKFGGALNFDGNDYISVPDVTSIRPTSGMTLETWVYVPSAVTTGCYLCKQYGTSSANSYALYVSTTARFGVNLGAGGTEASGTIPKDQWVHLAGTWSSSDNTNRLYIDGQLQPTTGPYSGTISYDANALFFGGDDNNADDIPDFWSGNGTKQDDVRIYNYARTADQIKQDYQAGAAVHLGGVGAILLYPSGQPICWVKADAGVTLSGSKVTDWTDQSGNGNNFTQATDSRRPTYVEDVLNGYPVLQMAAASQQTMTVGTNFTTPCTVIYVARMTGGTKSRILSGVSNNWLLGWWGGAEDQAYHEGWISPSGTPAATNNWYIYSSVMTGSLSTIYRNSTQIFSNASGIAGPNGLSLSGHLAASEFSDCQFVELVVYNSALDSDARKQVEDALKLKYGL